MRTVVPQACLENPTGHIETLPTVHRTEGKTNLDWVYDQAEPAPYFEVHGGLDYIIADSTGRLNRRAIKYLQADGSPPVVAELCAGYGLSSATMSTPLSSRQIYDHYAKPRQEMSVQAEVDRRFFEEACDLQIKAVIGVDIASHALAYGKKVGLFDDTVTKNLELTELDAHEKAILRPVQMCTATGAFSYITTNTLNEVLSSWDSVEQYPVFVFFPLVATPMGAIRRFCEERGMQVYFEPTQHWLPQRRFKDAPERAALEDAMFKQIGSHAPPACARENYLHATPFVAVPKGMDLDHFVTQILDQPPVDRSKRHQAAKIASKL